MRIRKVCFGKFRTLSMKRCYRGPWGLSLFLFCYKLLSSSSYSSLFRQEKNKSNSLMVWLYTLLCSPSQSSSLSTCALGSF